MKQLTSYLSLIICLCASEAVASDPVKVKILDRLNSIEPRTLQVREAKAKIVTTPDPEHAKVLELVMDYRNPGGSPGLMKVFPQRTIDPKKYVAIRYWVRSDSGTQYNVTLTGAQPRKDGKQIVFGANHPPVTDVWNQVTIPLADFHRASEKSFQNGAQHLPAGGGEFPEIEDFANFSQFGFGSVIDWRGSATSGHLMLDSIELVEK